MKVIEKAAGYAPSDKCVLVDGGLRDMVKDGS